MDMVDQTLREQRRNALSQHGYLKGIDFIRVNQDSESNYYSLKLYFIPNAPETITPDNIRFSKGDSVVKLSANKVSLKDKDRCWKLDFDNDRFFKKESPDYIDLSATYTLTLVNVDKIDPFFNHVSFIFRVDEPTPFDPSRSPVTRLSHEIEEPEIDYLGRDYHALRKLMLNRMSLLMPQWQVNDNVDPGLVIVEALAYAADQLSYFQDAVATEAYLGTARRRISVRRHARLLDYMMHEGCNARVWVQVQVKKEKKELRLPEGQQILSQINHQTGCAIDRETLAYKQAMSESPVVFETMYPTILYSEQNEIEFYTWGSDTYALAQGATKATLIGSLSNLKIGDVLIFEQVKSAETGLAQDVDVTQRQAVRLTKVIHDREDKLIGKPDGKPVLITEIEWHAQDALAFTLPVAAVIGGEKLTGISVVLGNIVLADHGRSVDDETVEINSVPEKGHCDLSLKYKNISFRAPFSRLNYKAVSASKTITQDPRIAKPIIELAEVTKQENLPWEVRPDLLNSNRFSRDFVVEIENNREVFIRFGYHRFSQLTNEGVKFEAKYRIGNGSVGNIGAETLTHIVTEKTCTGSIEKIRNPLPAQGGQEPEPLEQVRRYAPHTFWSQERCVTAQDYTEIAMHHPEVKRAATKACWTGSWSTIYIAIERKANLPVDADFKKEFMEFINQYRIVNHDVQIVSRRLVPLDIALDVYVKPGYFPNLVKQQLLKHFSDGDLPDGQRGFFHTDNFGYGEPVYLSQIVSEAVSIPGVACVDIESPHTRFQKWNQPMHTTSADNVSNKGKGYISVGKLEMIQLVNDPVAPEKGRLEFIMEELENE